MTLNIWCILLSFQCCFSSYLLRFKRFIFSSMNLTCLLFQSLTMFDVLLNLEKWVWHFARPIVIWTHLLVKPKYIEFGFLPNPQWLVFSSWLNLNIFSVTPEHRRDRLKINLDWKRNKYLTSCSLGEKV